MTTTPRPPQLITITMMAAVGVLSLNMIVPAFGEMADAFGVSYANISFLFSGYLIITGFLTLLAGPFSDRFGRRPVALFGVSLFIVASIVCAITPNLAILYATRIVHAAGVGSGGSAAPHARRLARLWPRRRSQLGAPRSSQCSSHHCSSPCPSHPHALAPSCSS